jgi:hypothetical protein
MSNEERAAVEAMGRKGQVVIRDQQRPVQYLDWLKPSEERLERSRFSAQTIHGG